LEKLKTASAQPSRFNHYYACPPRRILESFWCYSQTMLRPVLVLLTAAAVMQCDAAKTQPECAGPNRAPQVIKVTQPAYSEEALHARVKGTVVLNVQVGTDGRAHHIRVLRGLGYGLDEEAIRTVAQWLFTPAVRDSACVQVPATIEVVFHLPPELKSLRAGVHKQLLLAPYKTASAGTETAGFAG
jgi:TonB family protein